MNQTTKIDDDASTASPQPPVVHASTAKMRVAEWVDETAKPRLAIPLLITISSFIFMVNLGGYPLYTKGEPREAVTIFAIATGGGVILPLRAGVELPSKPLLMHWVAALLSMLAGGVSEWTVRLPSAIFALAGVLVCYYYVRRLFEQRVAFVAALMLATNLQYMQSATGARVDMTLTFFMEVAFFEFILIAEGLTRRRMLLYVAIALAILAKGPVGLVLSGAVALIWIATQWRWNLISDLKIARGAIVVVILAGWWYVAASIIGGRAFIEKQLIAENFVRFFGAAQFHEGHAHAFYYLEGALAAGFLPWTPMLAIMLWRAIRAQRHIESRFAYLLIWAVAVLAFYSFSNSKRGVYLLPMYPALATIFALYIVDAVDAPSSAKRLIGFLSYSYSGAIALAGAAASIGLAILWLWPAAMASMFASFGIAVPAFTQELRAGVYSHLTLSIAIPIATMGLGIFLLTSSRTIEKMVLGLAGGMGMLALAANTIVIPAIANTLSLRDFTMAVFKATGDQPTAYLLDMDYDIAFYSRRSMPIVLFKDSGGFDYLLCWESIFVQQAASVRARYQIVLTSNPTELDGSGRMLLLKPIAAPLNPAGAAVSV